MRNRCVGRTQQIKENHMLDSIDSANGGEPADRMPLLKP